MFKEIRNKYIRYVTIFIFTVLIFFCALQLNFLWLFGYSPSYQDIKTPTLRVGSELYTSDGKLIGRYFKENRTPVDFKDISPSVVNALVATEDARFYKHMGIDFRSLLSSGISTATGDKRGGSTITQQLAKNLYRTRYNKSQGIIKHIPVLRTIVSKLKEWMTAVKLESNYSKNDIITMYLNTVSFGNNAYGIKTASRIYFDKDALSLDVPESALLVGMLKGTSLYNPVKSPQRALERRNVALAQMNKYKYITDAELNTYKNSPLKLKEGRIDDGSDGDSYLRAAVAKYLEKWCSDNGYDLYEDGLKIYTTIDSKLQKYAEEAVKEQMKTLQKRFYSVWGKEDPWYDSEKQKVDYPNRAKQNLPVYAMLQKRFKNNPDSIEAYFNRKKKMKVFSWSGDRDTLFSTMDSIRYYGKILNTGMIQSGSTFKPFAYLAALESGMSPCDTFIDKPVSIAYQEHGKTEYWEPKNASYTNSYREMSLRWAMAKSVNTITAQVTEKVGWDNVVKWAHECGIDSHLESVPSVSLGPNDVSVYEMVKAYGTFLNNGVKTDPILVEKITDLDGNLIEEFKAKTKKVLSDEISWLMLYMFRGGMEEPGGTSQALWEWDLWKKNNQIGGKTGTSSDYVDAWYMGITKDLVTGIWVGCDERSAHFKNGETGEGSRTALPIFGKFMEKVYHDPSTGYTYGPFPKPKEKITRNINCPSPRIVADTTKKDSTAVDSLNTSVPVIEETQPQPQKEEVQKPEEKKPAEQPAAPAAVVPLTRKEERQLKRKQKQEEKERKKSVILLLFVLTSSVTVRAQYFGQNKNLVKKFAEDAETWYKMHQEALKNRVIMPVMELNSQTRHVLGHELVHAFQYHLLLEKDSINIQNVSQVPLWMVEGMAEYLSIGKKDAFTSMWMRDALLNRDIPSLKDLTNSNKYFPYRYGQAFWTFIGSVYGDTTIVPLFKATAKYGYENGLKYTLGYDDKALSGLWKNAIESHYRPLLKTDSSQVKITGTRIIDNKNAGNMNVAPAISPDGKYLAFLSEKDLFGIDLFLAEAKTGKIIKKLSSQISNSHIDDFNFLESAGAWSPDSKQFAFSIYSKGRNQLMVIDVASGNTVLRTGMGNIEQFGNLTWSPSGADIAFSGMIEGQSDIFSYNFQSKQVTKITDDTYSDYAPSY
eukprot:gene16102-19398_t